MLRRPVMPRKARMPAAVNPPGHSKSRELEQFREACPYASGRRQVPVPGSTTRAPLADGTSRLDVPTLAPDAPISEVSAAASNVPMPASHAPTSASYAPKTWGSRPTRRRCRRSPARATSAQRASSRPWAADATRVVAVGSCRPGLHSFLQHLGGSVMTYTRFVADTRGDYLPDWRRAQASRGTGGASQDGRKCSPSGAAAIRANSTEV